MKLMTAGLHNVDKKFVAVCQVILYGVKVEKNDIVYVINERGHWDLLRNGRVINSHSFAGFGDILTECSINSILHKESLTCLRELYKNEY